MTRRDVQKRLLIAAISRCAPRWQVDSCLPLYRFVTVLSKVTLNRNHFIATIKFSRFCLLYYDTDLHELDLEGCQLHNNQ